MDKIFYDGIFKRKSFHLFRNTGDGHISEEELKDISDAWKGFEALKPEIRTEIRIVTSDKVSFKRDAEYCIMIYSEKKDNYLMNCGYLGEQLDLYLVEHNIGTLWFGLGKTDEPVYNGLDYVIMIAIKKISDETMFRKDMFKATRKSLEEVWQGELEEVGNIARFAPSACNSQPWRVTCEKGLLTVSRYRKNNKIGIMSPKQAFFFNRIDMGIYLCFLELCLEEKKIQTERTLFSDNADGEMNKVAEYRIILQK